MSAAQQALGEWRDKAVLIVTNDGRTIVGTLKGFDNTINVVLEKSFERIYSESQPVQMSELGLHVIRGDNIAVIAEHDADRDATIDHCQQRAAPIKPVVH